MNTLVSLFLAGAAVVGPHAEEQPEQRVTIAARVFYPGGKAPGATQQRITLGAGPATWYVFTGRTLCEGLTISSEKPAIAGSGWKVDIKPAAQNSIQVAWDRVWVGGKAASGGGTKSVATGSGSPAVLDSIDGGARLQRQAYIDQVKNVSRTDLTALMAIEGLDSNSTAQQLENQLNSLEKTRRGLIEVQHLGTMHPQVISVNSEIATTKKQLTDALVAQLPVVLSMAESSSAARPVDGCDALSMNLQVTAESATLAVPTETEIWLVHKDPAGVESVQRQVVRSAGTSSSFVFDDIAVRTERGPITVEVYGNLAVLPGHGSNGQPWLVLGVDRRYVAGSPSFGWKTKEGGTSFGQDLRPDEVVAFNLQPLKDDEGVLVGHRFSVRVRTKILK
jgi:hypothetical protein